MSASPLLAVTGINHQRASVALRERLAVAPDDVGRELARLAAAFPGVELALLATCNRVELYAHDPQGVVDAAGPLAELARPRGVALAELPLYSHAGAAAARHLFRVAGGLDSLVVGEHQILGQVKEAYLAAHAAQVAGPVLHALFQEALQAGKAVRAQTRIGEGRVSVASVAVELVLRVFADLSGKTALVLGAGETAELVVQHLFERGVGELIVANRSPERASTLVQRHGGEWIPLPAVERQLHRASIVIGSTASPRPVLEADVVARALARRGNAPVLLLDLAVPRDIDPKVADLPGAYLYTIDDLHEIVLENLAAREGEAARALALVDASCARFEAKRQARDARPLIAELRRRAEDVRAAELAALFAKVPLDAAARREVERATGRIVNKLLHAPSTVARARAVAGEPDGGAESALEVLRDLLLPHVSRDAPASARPPTEPEESER